MQKKVAFQLGVIMVSSIALVFLSVPLFRGRTAGSGRPVAAPAVTGPVKTAGAVKQTAPEGSIKLGQIKDDRFYERLSRVAEVLPLERDPFFFSYAGPRSSRDSLDLTGILSEGDKPTAIIEDGFYKAGDSTDQFTVVKVLQDRVVLKDAKGEFELRLKQ